MAIDKLVYGKNVRDSVQANYIKTNEIIDKVNEGGSDTGLHAYTIYEGDTSGLSFTTTAPITNFKFIELYYTYQYSISNTLTGRSPYIFTKIYNPMLLTLYEQLDTPRLIVDKTTISYIYSGTVKYQAIFKDNVTLQFQFNYSFIPVIVSKSDSTLDTTNTKLTCYNADNNFKVKLESVIGYV